MEADTYVMQLITRKRRTATYLSDTERETGICGRYGNETGDTEHLICRCTRSVKEQRQVKEAVGAVEIRPGL